LGKPNIDDLERIAGDAYLRCRANPAVPLSPLVVSRALLGVGRVVLVDRLPEGVLGASTGHTFASARIILNRSLPTHRKLFTLAHELAHILLRVEGLDDDDGLEKSCDYLAACLMAPKAAALALVNTYGVSPDRIAEAALQTGTWAALRIGEATGMPVAAVKPGKVRFRGKQFEFASESIIRAVASGRLRVRGLRKVTLYGMGRAAVIAV